MENNITVDGIKSRIFKDSKGNNVYMNVSVEEMDWLVEQAEKSGAVHSRHFLMDTIKRYEKALKFYANKENYELSVEAEKADLTEFVNFLDMDNGETARKALDNFTKSK